MIRIGKGHACRCDSDLRWEPGVEEWEGDGTDLTDWTGRTDGWTDWLAGN